MNIAGIIRKCTPQELRDIALRALNALPNQDAINVMIEWAHTNDEIDELRAQAEAEA